MVNVEYYLCQFDNDLNIYRIHKQIFLYRYIFISTHTLIFLKQKDISHFNNFTTYFKFIIKYNLLYFTNDYRKLIKFNQKSVFIIKIKYKNKKYNHFIEQKNSGSYSYSGGDDK